MAGLKQAKRNHGLPLEALRYPITPPGLHYLLTHYDVPAIDADAWRLSIGGLVERPRQLTLAELRSLTAVEHVVTMECAGNGRGRLADRPVSQPWFEDGVGTARWRGIPLAEILREAGIGDGALELVFTSGDRGIEFGHEQSYQRSLSVEEALGGDALVAYEMNGQPLLPQHGFPVRLLVPGWYGMASVTRCAATPLSTAISTPGLPRHDEVGGVADEGSAAERLAGGRVHGAEAPDQGAGEVLQGRQAGLLPSYDDVGQPPLLAAAGARPRARRRRPGEVPVAHGLPDAGRCPGSRRAQVDPAGDDAVLEVVHGVRDVVGEVHHLRLQAPARRRRPPRASR